MMKNILVALMMISVYSTKAQLNPYYQRCVLKANVLSPIGIGVEFPLIQNVSLEYSARRMRTGLLNKQIYKDERLNVKFHWPVNWLMDDKKSIYCMLGFHSKYQNLNRRFVFQGNKEVGVMNQSRLLVGIGIQGKFGDFWIASEKIIYERKNEISLVESGEIIQSNYWKSGPKLTMGFSITLFDFKKISR